MGFSGTLRMFHASGVPEFRVWIFLGLLAEGLRIKTGMFRTLVSVEVGLSDSLFQRILSS